MLNSPQNRVLYYYLNEVSDMSGLPKSIMAEKQMRGKMTYVTKFARDIAVCRAFLQGCCCDKESSIPSLDIVGDES